MYLLLLQWALILWAIDPLSRGRRLVELSLAKSRAVVKRALVKGADNTRIDCPVKRPKVPSSGVQQEMPGPSSSTSSSPAVLGISETVNSGVEKVPKVPSSGILWEMPGPSSSTSFSPTVLGISEIVNSGVEKVPELIIATADSPTSKRCRHYRQPLFILLFGAFRRLLAIF